MQVWVLHGLIILIGFFVEVESIEETAAFRPFSSEMNWGIYFACAIAVGDCYLGWGLLLSLLLLPLLLLRGGLRLDNLDICLGWLGHLSGHC